MTEKFDQFRWITTTCLYIIVGRGFLPPSPCPPPLPFMDCPSLNLGWSRIIGDSPQWDGNHLLQTKKRNKMAQKTKNKHFQTNMENWRNIISCKEIFYSNLDTKAIYRHRKREIKRKKEERNYIFISPFCYCNISCVTNFWYFFQSIYLNISVFKNSVSTIIYNSLITST